MIEYTVKVINGDRYWYVNGKRHREDGPACEYANGTRVWYLNGESYTEQDFLKKTKQPKEEPLVLNIHLHDAVDNLVVASLQDYYDCCSNSSPNDEFINVAEEEEMQDAIKLILSHYMAGVDYDDWLRRIERKNNGI